MYACVCVCVCVCNVYVRVCVCIQARVPVRASERKCVGTVKENTTRGGKRRRKFQILPLGSLASDWSVLHFKLQDLCTKKIIKKFDSPHNFASGVKNKITNPIMHK